MITHAKKCITIVIEQPALNRVLDKLDQLAVTGYTVTAAIAGRGRQGAWRADGLVSDAGRMVSIICICDESRVEAILAPVYAIVARQLGIVTVTDCAVIRPEHF